MAKRPSLSDITPPAPAIPPQTTTPVPIPVAPRLGTSRSGSRVGKTGISFWVDPDAHRQLRLLSVTEDKPIQGLMEEALDLLFRQYGKHRLAAPTSGERD